MNEKILIKWINKNPPSFEDSRDTYHNRKQMLDFAEHCLNNDFELNFYKEIVLNIQRILNSDEPEYFKNARIEALVLGKRQ